MFYATKGSKTNIYKFVFDHSNFVHDNFGLSSYVLMPQKARKQIFIIMYLTILNFRSALFIKSALRPIFGSQSLVTLLVFCRDARFS
jgi:hypothetical protein